jgi:cytochrome b561
MNLRYTRTAIFLHWLVAVGLIGTFALGFYMHDLSLSPNKLKLYSWHKWAGTTLLALIIARLAWRLTHRAPGFPQSMGRTARVAAHAGHWLLYGLMLAIPFSGWLMSSAQGFQVVWFGVVPLPDMVSKDAALGALLKDVHVVLNYTLLVAVIGHAAMALHHHFIKKDRVLTRMLPMLGRTGASESS